MSDEYGNAPDMFNEDGTLKSFAEICNIPAELPIEPKPPPFIVSDEQMDIIREKFPKSARHFTTLPTPT